MSNGIKFTEDEAYLVETYLTKLRPFHMRISSHFLYIAPLLIIAVLGVYINELTLLLAACTVLVGYIAWLIYHAEKYAGAFRGVIEKYEARISELQIDGDDTAT